MSRRATIPLNSDAVALADSEIYAAHKDDPRPNALYDASGNKLALDPCDPRQAGLRKEWMDSYIAHGGGYEEIKKGGGAPSENPAKCPKKPLPVLEIVDRKSGGVVTATTITRIVGQKVELLVRTRPVEAMSDIEWTVPPDRVKDYTQDAAAGTITKLEAVDLQAENLDFYWISGGNRVVTVAATVDGSRMSATVTFDVLAPTDLSMTSKTGAVAVSDPAFSNPGLHLHFGSFQPGAALGIAWTFKAKAPANGAGQIAGVQLVNTTRTRTLADGTAQSWSTGGTWMLDTTVPYDTARAIPDGAEATWASSDSPGSPLSDALNARGVTDQFQMYFMYRPDGADSIWVTIGELDWNWSGRTTRTCAARPGGWCAASGVANSVDPNGAASIVLPEWIANAANLTWVP